MNKRRWIKRCAVTVAAALLVLVLAVAFADRILCVENASHNADAIIVLGGEPRSRAEAAARLFNQGLAPLVLVSGAGDCLRNAATLRAAGVPAESILVECESRSTRENAVRSTALLRAAGVKRALLVTDCFHSRRAVKTFRKYAPEIQISSAPVHKTDGDWRPPVHRQIEFDLIEYVKITWYAVRYGVNPF